MRTRFVEVTQSAEGGLNHGKFMVGVFDEEWDDTSELDRLYATRDPHEPMNPWAAERPLLSRCGWSEDHVLVFDLQTGEGAMFLPGGMPSADLNKHKVWVCPMFEPFLGWLYEFIGTAKVTRVHGNPSWFEQLPKLVEIPDAPPAMQGYRRAGV